MPHAHPIQLLHLQQLQLTSLKGGPLQTTTRLVTFKVTALKKMICDPTLMT